MAAIFSILFKKDNDVSEFESDFGKMKKHDGDLMPLNTGTVPCQQKPVFACRCHHCFAWITIYAHLHMCVYLMLCCSDLGWSWWRRPTENRGSSTEARSRRKVPRHDSRDCLADHHASAVYVGHRGIAGRKRLLPEPGHHERLHRWRRGNITENIKTLLQFS